MRRVLGKQVFLVEMQIASHVCTYVSLRMAVTPTIGGTGIGQLSGWPTLFLERPLHLEAASHPGPSRAS